MITLHNEVISARVNEIESKFRIRNSSSREHFINSSWRMSSYIVPHIFYWQVVSEIFWHKFQPTFVKVMAYNLKGLRSLMCIQELIVWETPLWLVCNFLFTCIRATSIPISRFVQPNICIWETIYKWWGW